MSTDHRRILSDGHLCLDHVRGCGVAKELCENVFSWSTLVAVNECSYRDPLLDSVLPLSWGLRHLPEGRTLILLAELEGIALSGEDRAALSRDYDFLRVVKIDTKELWISKSLTKFAEMCL